MSALFLIKNNVFANNKFMEIAISVFILLMSLFFIVKGGDYFVDASSTIAKKLKIPQLVVGATFVSIATTLPELIIAIISSLDGTTGLAVGNSVGSALCNIGLICGITFLICPSDINRGGTLKYYLLIFVAILLFVFSLWFNIFLWQAFVLIVCAILFFVFNFFDAKKVAPQKTSATQTEEKTTSIWLTLILFVIGALGVGGGAYMLVEEVTFLCEKIGISEQFVGLTFVAIGTSLPELTTTLTSIKKKQPYLAIGNIIGSNIINLTLILGATRITAWNDGLAISKQTTFVSLPLMVLLTLLLVLPILIKKKSFRWQGVCFIFLYVLYIGYLITTSLMTSV